MTRTDTAGGRGAEALLERARTAVVPGVRAAVESLPGPVRRVAMHHFGWEHADGAPATAQAGGTAGPALVFAAARALGGDPHVAVRAAAAVELAHNAALLHGGVLDGPRAPVRPGGPTARTVSGVPDALLAGDALLALALRLFAEDRHPAAPAASVRLTSCVSELRAGHRADRASGRYGPRGAALDERLALAAAGTGALPGCACAVGALYAGAGEAEVAAMDAFGREAGLAFRLLDDLSGLWGGPERETGSAGTDPAAHRRSLPVIAVLGSGTPAGTELAELYGRPAPDAREARRTAEAVERAGGRDWAQAEAADRMGRAVHQLARAVPDPAATDDLLALVERATRRTS